MFKLLPSRTILIVGLSLIYLQLNAQSLSERLTGVFSEVLELKLAGSPGEHGEHFKPANVQSSGATINALTNFIGRNISSIPLSSTVAGLTFDFSTGVPVATTTSLGPIFAERAQTLGSGRFNIGFNFSYLNMSKLRGINTGDMRFTFVHQDVGQPGMGDSQNEFDTIDLFMNLDLNATVLAFYLTVGITNRLDIGVAVPMVNVHMEATPLASIDSYTYLMSDTANHNFGDDPTNPVLTSNPEPINDDATGIGDIAIRAKYNFYKGNDVNFSALVDFRPPTGDDKNFLGAGKSSYRGMLITSATLGSFSPHLNLAYAHQGGIQDRDGIEVSVGYDQKVTEWLTLAADFLGSYEVSSNKEFQFPSENIVIEGTPLIHHIPKYVKKEVSLTNIPYFSHDNLSNGSFGFRVNPKKEMIFVANVIIPFNDAGLRSTFIPTVGFEFSF
jgi:hypothetical protein